MWYTTIKRFYNANHPSYTKENVKIFVKAQMITAEQYMEITGEPYVA